MKAVSLWQPWASLIALGAKTIETRSWKAPGSLIGEQIAIAATASMPPYGKRYVSGITLSRDAWGFWRLTTPLGIVDPVPLGAVVATAVLADCVPIHEEFCSCDTRGGHGTYALAWSRGGGPHVGLFDTNGRGYEHPAWTPSRLDCGDSAHPRQQGPYGDYRCGRWAWLLEDVQPLTQPVPVKGKQRLWNWDAAAS